MAMVALSSSLVDTLGDLVVDVREGFEAEVGVVAHALSLHQAFTDTNVPRSALVRSIIVREFRAAANKLGLYARSGQGGAVELYEKNNHDYAIIRLRGANQVGDELRVIANSGSTWGGLSEDGFWREVPYVFGCTVVNDSLQFFVAEVVGQTKASVAHLEFGWTHRFESPASHSDSPFTPDDGDLLDGWDMPDVGAVSDQA